MPLYPMQDVSPHVYINGESPVESSTPQFSAESQLALQTTARTGISLGNRAI
jgi:hypothetical protein